MGAAPCDFQGACFAVALVARGRFISPGDFMNNSPCLSRRLPVSVAQPFGYLLFAVVSFMSWRVVRKPPPLQTGDGLQILRVLCASVVTLLRHARAHRAQTICTIIIPSAQLTSLSRST